MGCENGSSEHGGIGTTLATSMAPGSFPPGKAEAAVSPSPWEGREVLEARSWEVPRESRLSSLFRDASLPPAENRRGEPLSFRPPLGIA